MRVSPTRSQGAVADIRTAENVAILRSSAGWLAHPAAAAATRIPIRLANAVVVDAADFHAASSLTCYEIRVPRVSRGREHRDPAPQYAAANCRQYELILSPLLPGSARRARWKCPTESDPMANPARRALVVAVVTANSQRCFSSTLSVHLTDRHSRADSLFPHLASQLEYETGAS